MRCDFKNMTMEPGSQKLIVKDGLLYGIAYPGREPMLLKDYVQKAYIDYLMNGGQMRYEEHPTWIVLENTKIMITEILVDLKRTKSALPFFLRGDVDDVLEKLVEKHRKVVNMQLNLEDKLCNDL